MKLIKIFIENKKKMYWVLGGIIAGVALIIGITLLVVLSSKEKTVYRETQAVKGILTVGVTESGSVSIGTSEQTFDLDISEYTGSSDSYTWNSNGGMNPGMEAMFPNSFAGSSVNGTSSGGTSSVRTLDVEVVYVTAGSEVQEGTSLLKLTDSSVSSIRQELEEDQAEAEITYHQNLTKQKQVNLQAKSGYDSNIAYGTYGEAEYSKTVSNLTESVEDLQEQLIEAQEESKEKTAQLDEMYTLLEEQKTVLTNAEYARDYTSREDNLYWWVVAVNTVSDTEDLIDTLEEDMETAEDEIKELNQKIASIGIELSLAEKSLSAGEVDAGIQKRLRQFQYDNAQEIYDVTVAQSDFETENANNDYEESKQKSEEFDSMIKDGILHSKYSGVISAVGISAGDSLEQDSSIITLNDYSEATITVTIDEDDMEAAKLGNVVNITFASFPDEVFKGEVTEIGDAQINSNTNKTTYSVTVSVTENVSGLYEGMSSEVTLITEESETVVYVSNRAVIREGTESYIKMKDSQGKIVKQKVTTGFSDGVNVEIKEGVSEGDIVLIEV